MLLIPLVTILLGLIIAYWQVDTYISAHEARVYTGVTVSNVDLSGMTYDEAAVAVDGLAERMVGSDVVLLDTVTNEQHVVTWSELGVTVDTDGVAENALAFGRNSATANQEIFEAWYRGHTIAPPVLLIDEAVLDKKIDALASELEILPRDASFVVADSEVRNIAAAEGYTLDKSALRQQLLEQVHAPTDTPVELTYSTTSPEITSVTPLAAEVAQVLSAPLTFYVEQPMDSADLSTLTLPVSRIEKWLNIDAANTVTIDADAARVWLSSHADDYARASTDARFYFDDLTEELVVIEPHVTGRELDIETTLQRLLLGVESAERSIPLAFTTIIPDINANAQGADLGITELLAEETTWFYDSSPERKTNIRIGAAKFHGLVVKPNEEFSFNKYLGTISESTGFVEGLIIIGGRTQSGVGGGICQVSTTMFQTVFWAGLDVTERNQHGYRVSYYEKSPPRIDKPMGMDAAIYSTEDVSVDFKFINNTPHHILIESYYRENDQSLTFKFYSTSLGRTVERFITTANETDPPGDRYEYNPELEPEEVEQVEWAAGGAIVSVQRIVNNQWGELRDEDYFISEYEPWANVYQYGDGFSIPTPRPTETPIPTETPAPEGADTSP